MLNSVTQVIEVVAVQPAADLSGPDWLLLGVLVDRRLARCGAVRIVDGAYGELKRTYVVPEQRRTGVAKRLLDALAAHVRTAGVDTERLETGIRQHAGLAFYGASGYRRVGPSGPYRTDPLSVLMEKTTGYRVTETTPERRPSGSALAPDRICLAGIESWPPE